MTLRDRVPNAVVPRRINDVREPEFWIYLGILALGYNGLALALDAFEASVPVVLGVGFMFGLLAVILEFRLKDRIDDRRDNPVGEVDA
jgi:hypothetical protein